MRRELFEPTAEGAARLLILIDGFTDEGKSLEGRTKLAKLDFFLRYPQYLRRALERLHKKRAAASVGPTPEGVEGRMVRFRYGPWDPAYFALLGSLIGRGLVVPIPERDGFGYRTTSRGRQLAAELGKLEAWREMQDRVSLLRQHLDRSGSALRDFVYREFPEVTHASWGTEL